MGYMFVQTNANPSSCIWYTLFQPILQNDLQQLLTQSLEEIPSETAS